MNKRKWYKQKMHGWICTIIDGKINNGVCKWDITDRRMHQIEEYIPTIQEIEAFKIKFNQNFPYITENI